MCRYRSGVSMVVILCVVGLITSLSTSAAAAQDDRTKQTVNIELIIDSSGSMVNPTDNDETRMEAAKNVLNTVIDGIPERDGVNVGLRIYGHKGDNTDASKGLSCESSELFVPLDGVDKDALRDSVDDLEPTGWTPLAESLERAGRDFNAADDDTINVIVLLTDGLESCDGDPAQAAEELANGRARITTNVIGFGTTEEE